MGISNRDLNPDIQTDTYNSTTGAFATGVTVVVALIENTSQVVAASLKAFGLSGSPVYSLALLRTVSGGLTNIGLGATLTAVDGGLTLWQGFSITLGASNTLQVGDMIALQSGGANTASSSVVVSVALKSLQDVKSYFNVAVQ